MDGLNVFVAIKGEDEADLGAMVQSLRGIKGVGAAFELSGGLDVMLRVQSHSAGEMKDIMERIKATKGVKTASSYLILEERK